jgi:hypothetical protein
MSLPTELRGPEVNTLPLIIIASSVVLVALITIALRITIKRDRATIKADMDEPHEIAAYKKRWGGKQ